MSKRVPKQAMKEIERANALVEHRRALARARKAKSRMHARLGRLARDSPQEPTPPSGHAATRLPRIPTLEPPLFPSFHVTAWCHKCNRWHVERFNLGEAVEA